MHTRANLPEPTARAEVARYCAWPTQASAYLTGCLEILRIRERYLATRGAGASSAAALRDFHDRLASSGALRTPAGRPLDLYLTEFGYFASGRRALPAGRRAAYLRKAFEIARRNARVREMLQYLLVQPPRRVGSFDTALLPRSGAITPVYRALRSAVR
jgi:hypothetical protein